MKDNNVEHKLKLLYSLQQVDSQLREVLELKGDLPSIVAELEAKTGELKAKIKELNDILKKSKAERDAADGEIIDLAEKIEKYKNQQLQVKSNKQYDALTKEIESAEERTSLLEKSMAELEGKMTVAKSDTETFSAQLDDLIGEFDEKKKELREVNKEHEKEELKLQHERDKLLSRIDKIDLERYERIKSAKNGKAVVPVRRNACGGCFNRIPPQKLLELRQNQKFFVCEHCGRILVSDQVVETSATIL